MVVASGSSDVGKPMTFRAFDLGGAAAKVTDGFTPSGLGKIIYADVALHQDFMFFAIEQPSAISLVAHRLPKSSKLSAVGSICSPRWLT